MAIRQNPYTGAELYLKDSSWASKYFGGQTMLNSPKRKFTYLVGFTPNYSAFLSFNGGIELASALTSSDYIFLTKAFEPPSFNIDTQVLDQYNKKRVVQTRVNYEPVSLRLHDDMDNKVLQLVDMYLKYYYASSYNNDPSHWQLDTIRDFINEGNWGFKTNREKNLFSSIWVAWVNGGAVSVALMMNPMISDIKFDGLDYSDGGTPLEVTLTLEYEGVLFKDINASINDPSSNNASVILDYLRQTEELGQFFEGPIGPERIGPFNRTPGLGELFQAGATFFGKYNGKPTIKDALNDFILRPIKGEASGILNSWGNFNFGGIGQSKSQTGLLGTASSIVGNVVREAEDGIINDIFSVNTTSAASDPRANQQFLNSTGVADKFVPRGFQS